MIVTALLNVVYSIFDILTSGLNIPSLPEEVASVVSSVVEYLTFGIALLANWTHLGYLLVLFGLIVAVDGGLLVYKGIMWFVRKIPVVDIE